MSINTAAEGNASVTTDAPTLSDDASHDDLVAAVNQLVAENERLRDELSDVRDQLSETRAELSDVRDQLSETQDELEQTDEYARDSLDHAARERAETRERVADLEETAENPVDGSVEPGSVDTDPHSSAGETTLHETVTRLEEVVAYPEDVAERELTANQRRARDVARDVYDYTRKVPSGRVIATPELKRVLTALKEMGSASYKTVGRVVDFLTKFGEGEVTTTTRENGDTVVVVTDGLAERLSVHATPRHSDTVVSGKARAD